MLDLQIGKQVSQSSPAGRLVRCWMSAPIAARGRAADSGPLNHRQLFPRVSVQRMLSKCRTYSAPVFPGPLRRAEMALAGEQPDVSFSSHQKISAVVRFSNVWCARRPMRCAACRTFPCPAATDVFSKACARPRVCVTSNAVGEMFRA